MDETKTLLDKNRTHGIKGCGNKRFFVQDNKAFDMGTLEEVDLEALPKEEPKGSSVLTCKFCGAKRGTPELMKEHLLALHKDDMATAKKAETPEPKEQEGVTPESIHKEEPEPKTTQKKRGRPKKVEGAK